MDCHFDDRALTRIERGCERIARKLGEQAFVFGQSEEDLPVMPNSVVAIVDRRDCDRDHLALGASQIRMTEHQFAIEVEMRYQRLGVNAVDF